MSEFKDREITTTLDSGDKELSFSYSATGVLVDLLKEEYYIRTKTDEFVIKAVEKGEQFNKYTATLNVEELEGTPFRYGFKTEEQTIKECLEIAFNGTGWHIGKCNVAKKEPSTCRRVLRHGMSYKSAYQHTVASALFTH